MLKEIGLLAMAGAIGTVARYAVSNIIHRYCGEIFPWGTLAVNMIGCFLFGLIWTLAETRMAISPQSRLVLLSGFMGAFTTFSTYAFETTCFLRNSQWWFAAGNSAGQLGAGVLLVFVGTAIGRLF